MFGSNRFCNFRGWPCPETRAGVAKGSPDVTRVDEASPWCGRAARAKDFDAWAELFAAYCEFYERPSTAEHRRRVWSWIEAGKIHCLFVVPTAAPDAPPGGLAHVRSMPSPLRGTMTGFLDDLFVSPAARGRGAFECLMASIRDLAAAEGWPQVRWITAADNGRARSAYERIATKTDWVTYQLDI
jgi:GNAT superfamily N-acetyltransferase